MDHALVTGSVPFAQGNRVVRGRVSPRKSGATAATLTPLCFGIKAKSPVTEQAKKEENSVKMEDKDIVTNLLLTGDNVFQRILSPAYETSTTEKY